MPAVVGRPGPSHRRTRGLDTHHRHEFGDRFVGHRSLGLLLLSVASMSNRAESFGWTSITCATGPTRRPDADSPCATGPPHAPTPSTARRSVGNAPGAVASQLAKIQVIERPFLLQQQPGARSNPSVASRRCRSAQCRRRKRMPLTSQVSPPAGNHRRGATTRSRTSRSRLTIRPSTASIGYLAKHADLARASPGEASTLQASNVQAWT